MKSLIITEKPSVAMDIAKVLKVKNKKDGYIENDEYIITWCVGHLINIAPPDKQNPAWVKWDLSTLPMFPEKFKLEVLSSTKKQFQIVKKLLLSDEVHIVICATDAGREGELIFRRVYSYAGCKKPIKRLWISSMTEEAILDGFRNLRDGDEYKPLGLSAYARAEADWLVGMNFSRLFSIKCSDKLSVGRVQTPVLAMLVQRRLEIENFKPTPYWQVEAEAKEGFGFKALWVAPPKFSQNTITEREKAEAIEKKCKGKDGVVESLTKKKGVSNPPLLFDLTSLQREANSQFNLNAQKTLSIVQSLYEKHKIVTYPRTDSCYISQDIFADLGKHINSIVDIYPELTSQMKENIKKTKNFKCVNDKKVSDHHAIIPTTKKPNLNELSDTEKKVYDMICRRFIASFLPPAEYYTTTLLLNIADEKFKATGKMFINKGWLEAENWKKSEDKPLPNIDKGDVVKIKAIKILDKQTQPPAHYNDASLLNAMETAGKQVENEELAEAMKERGLGTPATRAAIIERLIIMDYARREGKKIIATDKGIQLIQVVSNLAKELASPEMTGEWEYKLKLIEKQNYTYSKFMTEIKNFIKQEIEKILNSQIDYQKVNSKEIGVCPLCKQGKIIEGKKGFGCSRWKEGCKFVVWKTIANKKITQSIVKELLNKGETKVISGFTSKANKKFSAKLKLDLSGDKNFVNFQFDK